MKTFLAVWQHKFMYVNLVTKYLLFPFSSHFYWFTKLSVYAIIFFFKSQIVEKHSRVAATAAAPGHLLETCKILSFPVGVVLGRTL